MSERDALLRGVLAEPDEDAPRLVFADWLDEHGEPDRAEFIRVQCELAALDEFDPRRDPLADRERDLLAAHEQAWLGDWPAVVREWEFRRGFVESVELACDALAECGGRLREQHPLRDVRLLPGQLPGDLRHAAGLRGVELSELDEAHAAVILTSPHLTGVRELRMTGTSITADLVPAFARCPALASLESLILTGCSSEFEPTEPFRVLGSPSLRRLVEFRIGSGFVDDDAAEIILGAPSLPHWRSLGMRAFFPDRLPSLLAVGGMQLDSLDLSRSHAIPAEVAAVAGSRATAGLRALDLSDNFGIRSLEPLAVAPCRHTLRDVVVGGNLQGRELRHVAPPAGSPGWGRFAFRSQNDDPGDEFARVLAAMPGVDGLRSLELTRLTRRGLDALLSRRWPVLDALRLRHCRFGQAGLQRIARSDALPRLSTLTLEDSPADDSGLIALSESPHLPRLTRLCLDHNDFTSRAVLALSRSSALLRRLTLLDLGWAARLGGDALRPLAESLDLCPLLRLNAVGVNISPGVADILRRRLRRVFLGG